jgi:glycine cleavage system protein P-like pyridoxal-binding family
MNYLLKRVRENFDLPFDRWCKHEFIITGKHRWRRKTLRSIKCLHEKAELL